MLAAAIAAGTVTATAVSVSTADEQQTAASESSDLVESELLTEETAVSGTMAEDGQKYYKLVVTEDGTDGKAVNTGDSISIAAMAAVFAGAAPTAVILFKKKKV